MFKIILLFILLQATLFAENFNAYRVIPHNFKNKLHIAILDSIELQSSDIHELSGLAYKKGHLYALSDAGILYDFSLKIKNLKIAKLHLNQKYILKNKKLQVFGKKKRDSEGLCIYKDGFLVSFERKNRVLYLSKEGIKIKKMKLNHALEDNSCYESENKGLESVTYIKEYGVITAPEIPLKGYEKELHRLYSRDKIWKFNSPGEITDITVVDHNRLLVLLRKYSYLTQRKRTFLVLVDLDNCNSENFCKSRQLALFDSNQGWRIDNFEGLTKVGRNLYLMVSDDNDSIFQKTLFVLFEIKS
jgi:hypothetical protein